MGWLGSCNDGLVSPFYCGAVVEENDILIRWFGIVRTWDGSIVSRNSWAREVTRPG